MFYPELKKIYDDSNNEITLELIEALDNWLAFLPENCQDKITASKLSNKLNLDYSISNGLLQKMCNIGILKRIFAITCPECGTILKITDEQNLYNDVVALRSHNTCYCCDCEFKDFSMEDIVVRYKLIKSPSNDPKNTKNKIYDMLRLEEEKNDDNLGEILKKANYDSNRLFYNPTEQDYQKLDELFCGVINSRKIIGKSNNIDKGTSLEIFVEYLLNLIKPVTATRFARTGTNQLDSYAVNKLSLNKFNSMNPVLTKMGHTFICECKNENRKPKNEYFGKLSNELIMSRGIDRNIHKFGIIFSIEPPPSTYLDMAKKCFFTSNISIITFYKDEIEEIVKNRKNFLAYIDYKLTLIEEDLKENDDLKKMFV